MSDLQTLKKAAIWFGVVAGVLGLVYLGICIYTVLIDNVGTA
jgi:hypothetical protein